MRLVVLVVMFAVVGCGGGSGTPGAVPVNGTITFAEKPLTNASVTFIPMDGTPGFGGTGKTNAEGKYTLAGSRDNANGIPPGKYRVVVSKRLMPDGSELPPGDNTPMMDSPAKESLPGAYSNMQNPTLTATVPDGGGTLDFNLSKDGKKK